MFGIDICPRVLSPLARYRCRILGLGMCHPLSPEDANLIVQDGLTETFCDLSKHQRFDHRLQLMEGANSAWVSVQD